MDKKFWNMDKALAAVAIAALLWFLLVYVHVGGVWSGTGEVSVFPEAGKSKNYRLEADIKVETKLANIVQVKKVYTINKIHWPNGGYTLLEGCTTEDKKLAECSDGEEIYSIEVTVEPEDDR